MAGAAARFRPVDFIVRWLFAFALLTAFYNPTGYSYVEWLLVPGSEYIAVKIFIGLTMLSVLWFMIAMCLRAMGSVSIRVAVVFFACAAWALHNLGLLPQSWLFLSVLGQAGFAGWLAVGLSYVPTRQQISGQVTSSDEH